MDLPISSLPPFWHYGGDGKRCPVIILELAPYTMQLFPHTMYPRPSRGWRPRKDCKLNSYACGCYSFMEIMQRGLWRGYILPGVLVSQTCPYTRIHEWLSLSFSTGIVVLCLAQQVFLNDRTILECHWTKDFHFQGSQICFRELKRVRGWNPTPYTDFLLIYY